jgi:hypothetical protein
MPVPARKNTYPLGKPKKAKNGLFLQRGGLFEFPVSPKWMYNRKESL